MRQPATTEQAITLLWTFNLLLLRWLHTVNHQKRSTYTFSLAACPGFSIKQ